MYCSITGLFWILNNNSLLILSLFSFSSLYDLLKFSHTVQSDYFMQVGNSTFSMSYLADFFSYSGSKNICVLFLPNSDFSGDFYIFYVVYS